MANFTWVDLWLPISLDSCLCCEDVTKSKLVYTVLMRPKIRPKQVSAVTQRHVKNHFFITKIVKKYGETVNYFVLGNRHDGSWKHRLEMHGLRQKGRPSPKAMALTLHGCPPRMRLVKEENNFVPTYNRSVNIFHVLAHLTETLAVARDEGPVAACFHRREIDEC